MCLHLASIHRPKKFALSMKLHVLNASHELTLFPEAGVLKPAIIDLACTWTGRRPGQTHHDIS